MNIQRSQNVRLNFIFCLFQGGVVQREAQQGHHVLREEEERRGVPSKVTPIVENNFGRATNPSVWRQLAECFYVNIYEIMHIFMQGEESNGGQQREEEEKE